MEKITTTKEALKYIEDNLNMEVTNLSQFKWRIVYEPDDIDFCLKDDEELIDYANEQKEAVED